MLGDTVKIPVIMPSVPLPVGECVPAASLPHQIGVAGAAQMIHGASLVERDIASGPVGLWFLDKTVAFPRPLIGRVFNPHLDGKNTVHFYTFHVGRDPESNEAVLGHGYVSRHHLSMFVSPELVTIQNMSATNDVIVGGGLLAVGRHITIVPNAPFVISFSAPGPNASDTILIAPYDKALDRAIIAAHGNAAVSDARRPWRFRFAGRGAAGHVDDRPRQATKLGQELATPPQIRKLETLLRDEPIAEVEAEALHIRSFMREWIQNGHLELHVNGHKRMDERCLANVRKGGILLPTHSTDLDTATKIFRDGRIDPKFARRRRIDFRYGLGHSYGPIVFVKKPGTDMGYVNDFWNVLQGYPNQRAGMFRLTGNVDYNKNVKVRGDRRYGDAAVGQSIVMDTFNDHALMELFPQFGSTGAVPLDNICAVLVPEHLYDVLLAITPLKYQGMLIRIPGTGRNENAFLKGREDVARRSRSKGGKFEPKIGKDALFRYEIAYFKIVKTVLRYRYKLLRDKIDTFARAAARGELNDTQIRERIVDIFQYLPEAFHILHNEKQFSSHDGLSPLLHTMNTLIEAAYLAPVIAEEFPNVPIEDAFMALLFHDLGKVAGGRDADHGQASIEMARYYLKMMDVSTDPAGGASMSRRDRILELIGNSGLISEASLAIDGGENRQSAYGRIRPRIGGLLPLIFLVNFADVASIPGRSGRRMIANRDYGAVVDARPNLIRIFRDLL